jgi:sugar lactone lactonase YvrE
LKDGPAAGAQFYYPMGLASDAFGAAYVADTYNNRVVKIPRDRLAYIMAGNGGAGFSDGPGVAVEYNSPYGVARDAIGNMYVTDQNNSRVRKINTDGLITTLAGNDSSRAYFFRIAGVVADAQGNVYVADIARNVIYIITPTGAVSTFAGDFQHVGWQDGQGTHAEFSGPAALTIDGQGNIYVADEANNMIRKISTPGAVVSTLAGNLRGAFIDGTGFGASFYQPMGVAADAQGNVYVADNGNRRIRKVTAAGVVTTLAGDGNFNHVDGPGVTAEFYEPIGVAVDTSGNVFVTDNFGWIRKINSAGVVSTMAGDGPSLAFKDATGLAAEFHYPTAISVDAKGNLYVADQNNNRIRKVTATGVVTTFSGNGVAGK